jgi:hypothetical protein
MQQTVINATYFVKPVIVFILFLTICRRHYPCPDITTLASAKLETTKQNKTHMKLGIRMKAH